MKLIAPDLESIILTPKHSFSYDSIIKFVVLGTWTQKNISRELE